MKSNIVYLKCDLIASVFNVVVSAPIVAVSCFVAVEVPDARFLAGIAVGAWIGSAHNVLWATMTKFRTERPKRAAVAAEDAP